MKPPYRVQEYRKDMGAYHKHAILDEVSHGAYIQVNTHENNFYVILPSDDIFAEKLPQTIRTYQERAKLTRAYENMTEE